MRLRPRRLHTDWTGARRRDRSTSRRSRHRQTLRPCSGVTSSGSWSAGGSALTGRASGRGKPSGQVVGRNVLCIERTYATSRDIICILKMHNIGSGIDRSRVFNGCECVHTRPEAQAARAPKRRSRCPNAPSASVRTVRGHVGPERVEKHQLGVGALPEQKVAQALLAAGPEEQVDGRGRDAVGVDGAGERGFEGVRASGPRRRGGGRRRGGARRAPSSRPRRAGGGGRRRASPTRRGRRRRGARPAAGRGGRRRSGGRPRGAARRVSARRTAAKSAIRAVTSGAGRAQLSCEKA